LRRSRSRSTAQAEADTFQADHASELLEEREAEARELADKLTAAGLAAVRLHRAYLSVRMDIDSLVAAVPGATSRADGPEPRTHGRARYRIYGG
jgi:hypothetical protein